MEGKWRQLKYHDLQERHFETKEDLRRGVISTTLPSVPAIPAVIELRLPATLTFPLGIGEAAFTLIKPPCAATEVLPPVICSAWPYRVG